MKFDLSMFKQMFTDEHFFNTVKAYIDWITLDTIKAICFIGIPGLLFITLLGILVHLI